MAIPAGVILIWTGTNASIPTGWSRETTLDDKFPKAWGASVAPNQTGGSNTHTHTGSHTHTLISHAHTCSYAENSGAGKVNGQYYPTRSLDFHSHVGTNIEGTSGGGLASQTVTWSSVNQEPPYYKVIFVKPTGTVAALPAGICAHYYGSSAPILWNFCDGTNSTPDLRNKYLKGAETGGDAGAGSGATTHVHTVTHGHTVNSHTHSGNTGTVQNISDTRDDQSGTNAALNPHTHSVSLAAGNGSVNNYTNTTAGGNTIEVAYKKLGVIKATIGSARKGIVGLWLGTTASIPVNWVLCDGNNGTYDLRDKFVKIGATLAENNTTGGANTHTHTAVSHTHTATGTHTHTGTTGGASAVTQGEGSSPNTSSAIHTHPVTVTANTETFNNNNISADTVDHQPAYRTAAYIQLAKLDLGGATMMSLLM